MRILVVDDEAAVLNALGRLLRSWGHDVAEAAALPAAQERLREPHWDAVLTDLRLGDRDDGVEVVRIVRRDHPGALCVVVTGVQQAEALAAARRAGAHAIVPKPPDLARLRALLEEAERGHGQASR